MTERNLPRTLASLAATLAVGAALGSSPPAARGAAAEPSPFPAVSPTPTLPPGAPASPTPATATATPGATPTAGAVPTPSAPAPATAPPTPAAGPTEPRGHARPLRADRTRVGIVPGTSLAVGVFGGSGTIGVRSSNGSVDATYDAAARRATLVAREPGTAVVTVFDAAGQSVPIAVLVAPAAGVVPADVTVQLGGTVSPAYALARTNARIARDAQLQPGATIDIHGVTVGNGLRTGDRLDAVARVKIDGGGTFVDATGTTNVHVKVDAYPKLDPQVLLYSDDPERLAAAANGVLFRATVAPGRTARAYVYHVSDTPNRRLFLALQSADTRERVQLLGYSAGPENAFSYVGHRATLQYLLERGAQESTIYDVPADAPVLVPLSGRAMRAGDLVASIFDVRALDGGPLTVSVVAASGDDDPLDMLDGEELDGDGHGRRGEFSLAGVPPLALSYAAGAPEPLPFAIGAPTLANLRPGGRALGGDYGVLREVALQLTNPTAAAANVYFYEAPAGGNATTTMWFTGDPAPTELPCVRVATNRYAIKTFELAAGETRTVTGEYMTDGTSYFPLLFGLTATPPSPPPGPYSADACTPKTPPAGASPGLPAAPPTAAPAPAATP
ncbi:MAG: hypothetical protein NVSMB19_00560 [Vulcanimicrobiaceae bacterium]